MDKLQELRDQARELEVKRDTGEFWTEEDKNRLAEVNAAVKAAEHPRVDWSSRPDEFGEQLRELSESLGCTPSAAPQVGAGRGWGANRHGPALSTHPTSMVKNLQPFNRFGSGDWGEEYLAAQGIGRSPLEQRAKALGVRLKDGPSGLVPSGAWLPVSLPAPPVIVEGRPTMLMRSLLPAVATSGGLARYMVQTERTNAATVVEPLQVKPESRYTLEWRDQTVRVVAHTSEPINRFDLLDAPALAQFLDGELRYGVEERIESLLIDGIDASEIVGEDPESIPGFLDTSGLQTQAFDTDALVTIRMAIGKVEALGLPVTGVVMNAADWTAIEVMRNDVGDFILDAGPGDRTGRRLWGLPVVATSGMPAGTALVGDFSGSSALFVADGGAVMVQASANVADSFVRNAIVFLAETRLALGVLRPIAFVKATIAGS